MAKKIYLVYDYDEFCGAFSTLALAKDAVGRHLKIVQAYSAKTAMKLNFGEVTYEVYEDQGKTRWTYSFLVKTKNNDADLHRRQVVIYQHEMDEYDSMLKRMTERENALIEAPKEHVVATVKEASKR